ncbi:helix-turn-helix domain-containing protein [Natronospora cellulosivora (SeqCode)]
MLYQENLQEEVKAHEKKISCYVYKSSQPNFPNHCHTHLELIYILNGQMKLFLDGKSKVCKKGDLVFIPVLKPHAISYVDNQSSEHMILQLSMNFLDAGNMGFTDKTMLVQGKKIKKDMVINIVDKSPIGQMILKLHSLCEKDKAKASFPNQEYTFEKGKITNIWKLKGLVLELFSELVENDYLVFSDNTDDLEDLHELYRIQPVLHSMISYPKENMSMEDAAKMANMSYYNFSRTFKRLLGHSFIDYKNLLRVRKAEELLYETDKTITEIAELINFGSLSYFNRIFKKYSKLSPSEYRKKYASKKRQENSKLNNSQKSYS